MFKTLEKLTKMSQETQNQQLRLFIRMDLEMKMKILRNQKSIFHRLRSENNEVDKAILTLTALILAVQKEVESFDTHSINMIRFHSKNIKNRSKREKLLSYWAVVTRLKFKEKLSFRDIAKYLQKYHRFEVAHSTIFELWNELENNKKRREK